MRYAIAVLLLIASTGIMADQSNGNHYGQLKNGNNGNHYGQLENGNNSNRDSNNTVSVSEPSTLALIGLGSFGIVGFSAWRRSRK